MTRVLVSVKDDNLRGAEFGGLRELRIDALAQRFVAREQPHRDQAVRFAAAHRLREIESSGVGLAAQAREARLKQTPQALGEVVPAEEFPGVQLLGIVEILEVRDLIDQIVALHKCADLASLAYVQNRHATRPRALCFLPSWCRSSHSVATSSSPNDAVLSREAEAALTHRMTSGSMMDIGTAFFGPSEGVLPLVA